MSDVRFPTRSVLEDLRAELRSIDRAYHERLGLLKGFGSGPRPHMPPLPSSPAESLPDFTAARTAYVRDAIRSLRWEERALAIDLLEIEGVLVNAPTTMAGAIVSRNHKDKLFDRHRDAFLAIMEEIEPGSRNAFLAREDKLHGMHQAASIGRSLALDRLEEAARENWREAGGLD